MVDNLSSPFSVDNISSSIRCKKVNLYVSGKPRVRYLGMGRDHVRPTSPIMFANDRLHVG